MIQKVSDTIFMLAQSGTNTGVTKERAELQEISKVVNEGIAHDVPWELLLIGMGAMLVAIVLISLRRWWLRRQDDPSPLVLYSAIARKAGLNWSDRFTLWRIARACDLPTPITLLLARGALRHYARLFAQRLGPGAANKLSQRIKRIEDELFGTPSS